MMNLDFKLTYFLLLIGFSLCAQTQEEIEKESAKDLAESTNLTWEANKQLSEDRFPEAEKEYRRAISKSDKNAAAPYNLGNAYYNKETYSEAFGRFKQAGEIAEAKPDKHKAYHNMGNVFMKRKEYEKAVEAYKEALRNNPKDEETRYNLALAKEMLKKQQDEQNQATKTKSKIKTKIKKTTGIRRKTKEMRTKKMKGIRARKKKTKTRKVKEIKKKSRKKSQRSSNPLDPINFLNNRFKIC